MKNKNLIIAGVIVIVAGAVGFFGGLQYQKSKQPIFGRGNLPDGVRVFRQQDGNSAFRGTRPISGEIVSVDGQTLTVKLPDGGSKIVVVSDSTTVNKTTDGSKDDLKTGEAVMVVGSEGTDGTVTAQIISIGGRLLGGPGPQSDQPEPSADSN